MFRLTTGKRLPSLVFFWNKKFSLLKKLKLFHCYMFFGIFFHWCKKFLFVGNKAKGRISKRVFQENEARQIFWKTNISYPLIRTLTCAYQGVRNVCFSENLACFVFLKHPFWDSPFCLITDVFLFCLLMLLFLQ